MKKYLSDNGESLSSEEYDNTVASPVDIGRNKISLKIRKLGKKMHDNWTAVETEREALDFIQDEATVRAL